MSERMIVPLEEQAAEDKVVKCSKNMIFWSFKCCAYLKS